MKLDSRAAAAVLANPGGYRAVLLHGPDAGLVRERGSALVRAVLGAGDDPFRLAEFDREGFPRIPEEMAALALTGGRRVVRVRDADDRAASAVTAALAGPGEALLVLEAGELPARSKLRALIERAQDAAAIGCYPEEGRALSQTIRARLEAHGVSISSEALDWLTTRLGADRMASAAELEKLALYAGAGGKIEIADAQACTGDLAGLSLDDALFAATGGDLARADRALEQALAEGTAPVGAVRAALLHLQRLHRVRAAIAAGTPDAEAQRNLRPPVFVRRTGAFSAALRLWPIEALSAAMESLFEAERACKQTGAPAETICRNAIAALARRAARLGKARNGLYASPRVS
jgi:DNA polymerase-3 subunit delta